MKVGIVLPANILHAPYLEYYTAILQCHDIDYRVIYWNKVNVSESDEKTVNFDFTCPYNSNGFKKLGGYYLFSRFVIKEMKREKYDKVIILVPQIGLFLSNYLKKYYKNNYILDIRDYSRTKIMSKKYQDIIRNSTFTVISSEGYKKWLPNFDRYVISHNVFYDRVLKEDGMNLEFINKDKIVLSNIGSIRHYEENIKIINMFKHSKKFILRYIGTGVCEKDLERYCQDKNIQNVFFHGRYSRDEELSFYNESDLINLIMPTKDLGPQTSMSNRFYNACISKRPVIISNNSFMSDLVLKYNLGLVVDIESDNLEERICEFINSFDFDAYKKGCNEFLLKVGVEEKQFESQVRNFLSNEWGD